MKRWDGAGWGLYAEKEKAVTLKKEISRKRPERGGDECGLRTLVLSLGAWIASSVTAKWKTDLLKHITLIITYV